MKTILNTCIITLIFCSGILSCTKDLEIDPTSVITNESFWKNESDVEGVLNGMYSYLRNVNKMSYQLGEGRSEIFRLGIGGSGNYDLFYNNTLNPSNLEVTGNYSSGVDWEGYYKLINSANLLLKYVPTIEYSSDLEKNNILAQAYTMRAWTYFLMTKTWGDVVVRTEPTEGFDAETTFRERTPVQEVFTLIKSDLEKAIGLFPDNNIPSRRYFWSKPAANTLKADVYLWTGKLLGGGESDFQIALQACNDVEGSNLRLLDDFEDIYKYDNKSNEEILMAIYFDLNEQIPVFSYFRDLYMFAGLMPAGASQATRDFIGSSTGGGFPVWQATELVKDQFNSEDKRKEATFYEIYDHQESGDSLLFATISLKGTGAINSGGVREYVSDIIIYRYADVLLLKAEAKNALGQDPSVELNLIRQRAFGENFEGNEFVSGSTEMNNEAILKERLLELIFEGKRWWDLRRFEKEFDIVPSLQDRKGQDYLKLFPISINTLSLEPLIEQNPGW